MVRLTFLTTSKTIGGVCLNLKKHQYLECYLKITLLTSPGITDVRLYHTNHIYDKLRSNVMGAINKLLRNGFKITVLVKKSCKNRYSTVNEKNVYHISNYV